MTDAAALSEIMQQTILLDQDTLLSDLVKYSGEDFAVPVDSVRKGYEIFYAHITTFRTKLCKSDMRSLIKADFEKSGPVMAALLLTDAHLANLQLPIQASIGALILKLGVDRICDE